MIVLVLFTYAAIQGLLWEIEVVMVDRSDPDNPFRCYKIRLNLPRDINYSPEIPLMSKV